MLTIAEKRGSLAELIERQPYRLTVGQYHRMIAQGILKDGDRVELLEGCLVAKMTHNPPHASSVSRITRRLLRLLPETWVVRVQAPITLKGSEPEPDVAIARGPEGAYAARHPGPGDVAVLIEVADSSLLNDRRFKGRLYAKARMPELWIVNLVDEVVEVYTSPKPGKNAGYQGRRDYPKNESVPLTLDGTSYGPLPVHELLA